MKFVIGEYNRVWEDRNGVGHDLQNRAKVFNEDVTLKEIWDWIRSNRTGDPRGSIEIILEGK